jgi:hypothetical protein
VVSGCDQKLIKATHALVLGIPKFFLALLTPDLMTFDAVARAPDLHFLLPGILSLPASEFSLLGELCFDESVLWLDPFQGICIVVDEAKSSGSATTELCLKPEDDHQVFLRLQFLSNEILDCITSRSCSSRVLNIQEKLPTIQETIHNVFPNVESGGGFRHWIRPSKPPEAVNLGRRFGPTIH